MRDVFGARDDQVGHFFAFLWLFGGHAAREKKRSFCEVCENSPPRRFRRIGDANEVAVRCALVGTYLFMCVIQIPTAYLASSSDSQEQGKRAESILPYRFDRVLLC